MQDVLHGQGGHSVQWKAGAKAKSRGGAESKVLKGSKAVLKG